MLGASEREENGRDETGMSNPLKKSAGKRRGGGPMAVGAYVPAIARKVFEAHGFPSASILSDWPEIIGADFAAITAPERLVWPRGEHQSHTDGESPRRTPLHRRTGATLFLRVEGPRSLEVQHIAPQLLERINTYFGYRAVAELRIMQGPVRRDVPSEPHAREVKKVELDKEIEDEKLRAALEKLGASID
jgi:hypothetical protein